MASLRDLRRYRYLFGQMVRRELRQKYKGSALGVLWYLVNPLVLMGAYTVMFTFILHRPFQVRDYALFVLTGIVTWTFFQSAVMAGATSLLDQGALIRKAVFPRETIPTAVVTVQLAIFLCVLALVAPVLFIVHGSLSAWLLLLPLYVLTLFAFVLGFALLAAVLHAYFRDVAPILGAVLLPWFFITPIFFPPQHFPGASHYSWVEPVVRWANPVAPYIDSVRSVVFDGRFPGWATTAYVLAGAVIVLPLGWALFRRLSAELAVVV